MNRASGAPMREGDLVAGRFRVEGIAGRGGMGDVYRAWDVEADERVALKLVSRMALADRFEREAAVLASLRHPGIVRYVAHGRAQDGLFLAMEWLEGEDLAHRLARGRLALGDALAVVTRIAEALGAAHRASVIHRDVKPENVLLVAGALEAVRVVDFGLARMTMDDEPSLTEHGAVLGSPAYMSPEQARGELDLDARTDVYALGCVLFECLTGRPPFVGEHPMAVLAKILLEEPPRASTLAPGVPEEVDRLLSALLAKDRDTRPRDGAAVVAAIARDAPPSSRVAPGSVALGRLERRLVFVVLVGGGAASPRGGPARAAERQAAVRAIAASRGARVEALRDGSFVVVLALEGVAVDRATEAARVALDLARTFPEAVVALAAGRAVAGASATVGEAIDRASRLVTLGAPAREVRVDDVTAGLLATRFDVRSVAGGLAIVAPRPSARAERTLLGRPTPFVGRRAEHGALVEAIDAAIRDRSATISRVTGAPGSGKSRLRYEVLRHALAQHPDAQVWVAWGESGRAGTPLAALSPMIRRVAGIVDADDVDVRVQKLRACVARSVPDVDVSRVAEFLGELASVPFPDVASAPLRAARADRALLGDQVARAWSAFVVAELTLHPIVLVIEDAQWVDRRTWELLDAAIAAARSLPLAVLAFGRSESAAGTVPSEPSLVLELGPLDAAASAELVRAVLGDVDARRASALRARADGNPFLLEELIRAEAEGRDPGIADTATALAELALGAVAPEARRVARAASILGASFEPSALAPIVDLPSSRLDALLADLAVAELLVPPQAPGDAWTFRHATFHEAAYAMLTADDRRLGHRLAAEHLCRAAHVDPSLVAGHLERGDLEASAATWHAAAAVQARDRSDEAALEHHVARAIACGAEGALRGELLLLRAETMRWVSDHAAAAELASAALPLLEPDGHAWFAAASEAMTAHGRLGRTDEVVALARAILAAGLRAAPSVEVIAALARTHEQLVFGGRYELAKEVSASLFPMAEPLAARDPVAATWLLFARADAALVVDDRGRYVELMQALVEAFDAVGDERNAMLQRSNLADAYLNVGHAAEAAALCEETLGAAPGLVSPHAATAAKLNLARALARLGQLPRAERLARDAMSEARALEGRRLHLLSCYSLAEIELSRGRPELAERTLRDALAGAEVPAPLRAVLETRLAEACLALGGIEEAHALSLQAMKTLFELRAVEEGEVYIRRIHAEVLAARGHVEAAREVIRTARDRLLSMADRIDARWLDGYLQGVPDHARALALAVTLRA